MSDESRLDRIEEKLDKLTDVLIQIAKTEEKLVTLEKDRNLILERLERMDDRVSALEADSNRVKGIGSMALPIWTAVVSSAIAVVLAYFGFKK
jgi:tetrahydromethanopterin S-methyltransferase subunit G